MSSWQTLPPTAEPYLASQLLIRQRLEAKLRETWARMEARGSWSDQFAQAEVGAQATALVTAAQLAAVRQAETFVAATFEELYGATATAPALVASMFTGVAGDGRPVDTLLAGAVAHAGQTYTTPPLAWYAGAALGTKLIESTAAQALEAGGNWLVMAGLTALSDAARAAETTSGIVRGATGYVRMLTPPSCARCVILAGRRYDSQEDFERHPDCDCRKIPVAESTPSDYTVNPYAYFESLPTTAELLEQNPGMKVRDLWRNKLYSREMLFGKAGAQAILDGADMNQVVNARRGMSRATSGLLRTSEGTSRMGLFGQLNARRAAAGMPPLRVRWMPESIYEYAGWDTAKAVELLRLYGYII